MKELFSGLRRKETQEPVMKKKGDVYLFGVTSHEAEIADRKFLKYASRVRSSDHLLLEGSEYQYGPMYPSSYENGAYALFQGEGKDDQIHFLEEGYDSPAKLKEYGVNQKDTVVYLAYRSLLNELQAYNEGPVDLAKDIQAMKDSLQTIAPSLKQEKDLGITIANAFSTMRKLIVDKDSMAPFVPKGKVLLQLYHAKVRDYEVLGPRVKELTQSLPGKKSLFFGNYHMPNMERALNGEEIAKPLPWDEHVSRLSEEDQYAVKVFQRVSQGKA